MSRFTDAIGKYYREIEYSVGKVLHPWCGCGLDGNWYLRVMTSFVSGLFFEFE